MNISNNKEIKFDLEESDDPPPISDEGEIIDLPYNIIGEVKTIDVSGKENFIEKVKKKIKKLKN